MKAKNKITNMKTTNTNNTSSSGGSGSGPSSKSSSKETLKSYEKELDDTVRQLNLVMNNGITGGSTSNKKNPTPSPNIIKDKGVVELRLMERKIFLLVKLKQWNQATEEGYKVLGKKGPSVMIYKCIIVGLCRLSKFDEVTEVLEQWKRVSPKCPLMLETIKKMDKYLTAIRSGVDATKLLQNLEEVIEVHENPDNKKITVQEPNWKFRPPPSRHLTFSMCSRITSGESCLFGNDCQCAHSKEEMREWQQRVQWKSNEILNIISAGNEDNSKKSPSRDLGGGTNNNNKSGLSRDQIPPSYRSLPAACMYYLAGLAKRVQETKEKDIKSLFVDGLPDVKIKFHSNEQEVRRIPSGPPPTFPRHRWIISIASKSPLATVTLLNDPTRPLYSIRGALFINQKRQSIDLIELHPNNKNQLVQGIQVLNTFVKPELFIPFNGGSWPSWCCYQIEVIFQAKTLLPGRFEQDIIFDFKSDPKIRKRMGMTLEPPREVKEEDRGKIMNQDASSPLPPPLNFSSVLKSGGTGGGGGGSTHTPTPVSSSVSPSPSQSVSDCEDNLQEEQDERHQEDNHHLGPIKNINFNLNRKEGFELVDSVTGLLVKQLFISQGQDDDQDKKKGYSLLDEPLNKDNYVDWMNLFISQEIQGRDQAVKKLSQIKVDVDISPFPEGPGPLLLGTLRNLNEDSKLGRLIFSFCSFISITDLSSSTSSTYYLCRVIQKSNPKTDDPNDPQQPPIHIIIGRRAIEALKLTAGSRRKLNIFLHLDHSHLESLRDGLLKKMKKHLLDNILFPQFNKKKNKNEEGGGADDDWDINKLINPSSSSSNHEVLDESLNPKQRRALEVFFSREDQENEKNLPLLVTGPSGCGKSYLIARTIMKILKSSGDLDFARILICTYNEEGGDQFITHHLKDLKSSSVLRIYPVLNKKVSPSLILPEVKTHCLLTPDEKGFRYPTLEELLPHKVIITSVQGCAELVQLGLPDYIFSHIFLDDCHLIPEIEGMSPLLLTGSNCHLLITGDLEMMHPETFSNIKSPTLIERLFKTTYPPGHHKKITLDEIHYPVNPHILQFISTTFYPGGNQSPLKCANPPCSSSPYSYFPLTSAFVQMGEESRPDDDDEGFYNMKEIHEIRDILINLVKKQGTSHPSTKGVLVLTPYPDQALGLRIKLKLEGLGFVDVEVLGGGGNRNLLKRYSIVVLSPVRTFKKGDKGVEKEDGGVFSNPRAIYEALQRTEELFIVVGDFMSLCNVGECRDIWRQYVKICKENNSILGLPTSPPSQANSNTSSPVKMRNPTPISRPSPKSIGNLTPTPTSPPPSSIEEKNMLSPLQKIRSIWNDEVENDNRLRPSSTTPSALVISKGHSENPLSLSYSNIWKDLKDPPQPPQRSSSSSTSTYGSLGNLGPSSSAIWGWGGSGDNSSSNPQNQNSLDLPDVRLMAEQALNPPSTFNKMTRNPPPPYQPYPYHHPTPPPQKNLSNMQELLNLPNPFANLGMNPNPPPPPQYHQGPVQAQGHLGHNLPPPSFSYLNSCSDYEIAQANYASYLHTRRMGGFPSYGGYGSNNNPPLPPRLCRPLSCIPHHHPHHNEVGMENFNNSSLSYSKETLKNLDFFSNNGTVINKNQKKKKRDKSRSSSRTSSSSITNNHQEDPPPKKQDLKGEEQEPEVVKDNDGENEKFMLDSSTDFPGLENLDNQTTPTTTTPSTAPPPPPPPASGWIEVKNTKKNKGGGGGQKEQKKKNKAKKENINEGENNKDISGTCSSPQPPPPSSSSTTPSLNGVSMSVDEMIESLKDMGFDKRQAIKAIQACNRDLERSVEWLITHPPKNK